MGKRFIYNVFMWIPLIRFTFCQPFFDIIYGQKEGMARAYKILEDWEKLNED